MSFLPPDLRLVAAFHGTRTHHRNPLFDQVCQVASATPVQINSHAPVIMTCPPAEPESAALDATALTALQHQLLEMGVQQEVADALLLAVKQEKADAGVLPVQVGHPKIFSCLFPTNIKLGSSVLIGG